MAPLRAVDLQPVRLPPHSEEAERGVLGSCLLSRDAITLLATHLEPRDFFYSHHAAIWRAMTTLFHRRTPLDLITLVQQLRTDGALERIDGAETYITGLIEATPTAVHAEHYAGIVREASIRRQLAGCGEALVGAAYNDTIPLSDVIADADTAIHEAAKVKSREGYVTMNQAIANAYERMDSDRPRVIPTGLGSLDSLIGGVMLGQLDVIAARPSVGKSALAVLLGYSFARRTMPFGFISLEMSESELTDRFIALDAGVDMHRLSMGVKLTDGEQASVTRAMGKLAELPLLIDDRSDASLYDVLARIRTMHAEHAIKAVAVDYLQLMHVSSRTTRQQQNRTTELGTITREFKTTARELGIVIFCLSQLNRAVETRKPPIPMLADLRESGSIEQDADIVCFIHRPDFYSDDAAAGIAELHIAKHRNGPVGVRSVRFLETTCKFVSLERQ